jgi:hypothetical protein
VLEKFSGIGGVRSGVMNFDIDLGSAVAFVAVLIGEGDRLVDVGSAGAKTCGEKRRGNGFGVLVPGGSDPTAIAIKSTPS